MSCVFSGPCHQIGPAPFSAPLPRIVTLLAFGAHTKGWCRQAGKELRYDGGVATCGKALEFSHAHTVAPASIENMMFEERLNGAVLKMDGVPFTAGTRTSPPDAASTAAKAARNGSVLSVLLSPTAP